MAALACHMIESISVGRPGPPLSCSVRVSCWLGLSEDILIFAAPCSSEYSEMRTFFIESSSNTSTVSVSVRVQSNWNCSFHTGSRLRTVLERFTAWSLRRSCTYESASPATIGRGARAWRS